MSEDIRVTTARHDPRINRRFPRAVVILSFLCTYLDTQQARPLKIEVVRREGWCDFDTAVAALRALVAAGYIEKGARPKGEARHYRLLPAPLLPAVKRLAA